MTCEQCLDLISARLDGELTVQEEAQLTAHLQECPACRAIAEDLKQLHAKLVAVGEVKAPAELSQTVMAQITKEKNQKRRRFIRQLGGLAACLMLCVGILRVADATYSEYNRQRNTPAVLALSGDEAEYCDFSNDQYFDVTWGSTPAAPSARIIGTEDALAEFVSCFPQDDLSLLTKAYDPEFFSHSRLLAVVLEEPSSSNRHRLDPQGLFPDSVTVIRTVPEVGDCAMAAWLILAEVDESFSDGDILAVAFSE